MTTTRRTLPHLIPLERLPLAALDERIRQLQEQRRLHPSSAELAYLVRVAWVRRLGLLN